MKRKPFLKQFRFIFPIGLAILLISSPTSAQNIYSVDVVTPNYIEANTILSAIKGDDHYETINLPFTFTFFKQDYNSAWVSTNGFLSFTRGSLASSNTSLPTPDLPNGAIYAFWDDLNVDAPTASVRTETLGTEPNKQFVIEWRNVKFFGDPPSTTRRIDFEIVLHQNGVILLQYRNIDTNDGREMGNSATVGVENEKGDSAVQATLASFKDGQLALRFAQGSRSVPVDIKPRHCPNRLNVDSDGVLHVAILGTSDLDVTTIDPKTVTMGGVAVLSKQKDPWTTKKKTKIVASKLCHQGWIHEDVGTPYEPFDGKTDPHQCNNKGPDGHLDMVLKFDTQAIADSLGDVEDEEAITLQLRGQLLDGTEIAGEDVVIVKKEKHHGGHHKGHDKDRDHGHDKDKKDH